MKNKSRAIKTWLLLCVSGALAANLTAGMRTYRQTVEVSYDSSEAAAHAQLTALPLPIGKKVAFSSRWDDTHKDHSRMVDVLTAHGYKGTFYLGRTDQAYADTVIRKMLDKGCSIGAHTVHHPKLPELGPNAIFKEILANRISLESIGNTCVVAFTLPYSTYTTPTDPEMPRKIGDCLRRSGLLGGPERWPDSATKYRFDPKEWVGAYTFSINDRDPQLDLFEKAVKTGLQTIDGLGFESGPHMVLGIHTWQKDDKGFNRFGEIIATEANRPDWWYCNENEYVAYRIQMYHSRITKKSANGKTATFTVDRIVPFELGDRIELGLQASSAPRGVSVGGNPLTLTGNGAFMLPHDAAQQLPARIATFPNPNNNGETDESPTDKTLPGLRLALYASTEKNLLSCSIKNTSDADFKDMHLTFRVPPKWKTGIAIKDLAVLKAGTGQHFEIALGDKETDPSYDTDALYFAVQCDLTDAQGAARAYGTTEVGQPSTTKKAAP